MPGNRTYSECCHGATPTFPYFARVLGLPMPGTIENCCFEPLEIPESLENTKAVFSQERCHVGLIKGLPTLEKLFNNESSSAYSEPLRLENGEADKDYLDENYQDTDYLDNCFDADYLDAHDLDGNSDLNNNDMMA
jgi:hypothetical protein